MARRTIANVKDIEPLYLTVAGLQKYLGVGTRNTQQVWRENRLLPFYMVAGKILYKKSDVDRFVERHRIGAKSIA